MAALMYARHARHSRHARQATCRTRRDEGEDLRGGCGLQIFNVPNEWKKLMSKAGVTEEQMQDKETAMFIVSFVASTLGNQQGTYRART